VIHLRWLLLGALCTSVGCSRANDPSPKWIVEGAAASTSSPSAFVLPDLPKMFEVQTGKPSYPNYGGTGPFEQPLETGITQIAIHRTWCFGSCPSYTAVITADGTVRYEGRAHVARLGTHLGRLREVNFYRLSQFIARVQFFALAPYYNHGGDAFDAPSCYVLVADRNRTHVVKDHSDTGPAVLWAIEELIDKALADATWDGE
jgi:hypothetical protein